MNDPKWLVRTSVRQAFRLGETVKKQKKRIKFGALHLLISIALAPVFTVLIPDQQFAVVLAIIAAAILFCWMND